MKNSNDNLKEKTIRANELESVSGGRSDNGPPYRMTIGGTCTKRDCGNACYNACCSGAIAVYLDQKYNGVMLEVNRSRCNGCGKCADVCPTGQVRKYS